MGQSVITNDDTRSVWTGINGHGKSQFLGHIILDAMKHGARVCIANLELQPRRLLMRLTRQAGAIAEPTRSTSGLFISGMGINSGCLIWLVRLNPSDY